MALDTKKFNALKVGDKIDYCFEGGFVITAVHRNEDGSVDHIHAKHVDGRDEITLDAGDADLIDMA